MKTKEFIKKVEESGNTTTEDSCYIHAREPYFGTIRASIAKFTNEKLSLNAASYPLIKLCIEYAETPLEEREEEKKYIVILPDPEANGLIVHILAKTVSGRIVINGETHESIKENARYHLTEAEIKRNHEYLWQFAKEVTE